MPGYDGTGPLGRGTMSGLGRGPCMTDDPPKTARFGAWCGHGFGLGRGARGRRFAGRSLGVGLGRRRSQ